MLEIPIAWALAFPAGMGVKGVFTAIPTAEVFITLMGLTMFLRGKWKEGKI
ncbi:MAG: hypothetical protein H7039_22725 [Bryobacteraceae bacterium]|nr:hypothetical protein [Bryobacteraceae bacterium]